MAGKLFLSGGGNQKQTIIVDGIFLKNLENILYIPLAWPNEDFTSCKKWFESMILQHKKVEIEMLLDLEKDIDLHKYDAIYIGGGNTFKLLKKIKDSKFDKKLIKYYKSGGIIYGGSAGAIILGKDIRTALLCADKDKNLVNLKDTSGLNLVKNFDIQCHFEDDQVKEHQDYIKKTNTNIIAIPEESALVIEDNEFKAIGGEPLTVITSKDSKKYKINEVILT